MKQMKKIFLVIFFCVILISTVSCGAEDRNRGTLYNETLINIDDIKPDTDHVSGDKSLEYCLKKTMGFNNICTPYIIVGIYLIVEHILIKKYKNSKFCVISSVVLGMMIYLIDNIIVMILWEESLFCIVTNSVILIIGLIWQKRKLKQCCEKTDMKLSILMKIFIIILILSIIIINKIPKVHIVESESGFNDEIISVKKYDIVVSNEKKILNFKIIDVDKEGIVIEYSIIDYESRENDLTQKWGLINYKTEIVQQKILWNVNYYRNKQEGPLSCKSIGETEYYIRFEK